MNQTLQYFQAYCKLNDLPYDESRWDVAEQISGQNKKLVSLSRYSYFLTIFDQYCGEEIDLETMMTIGDGMNPTTIAQQSLAHQAVEEIMTRLAVGDESLADVLIVIDQSSTLGHDMQDVVIRLAEVGSELAILTHGLGNQVGEDESDE